jgi:hypothetical protein
MTDVIREKFDYTKFQSEYREAITSTGLRCRLLFGIRTGDGVLTFCCRFYDIVHKSFSVEWFNEDGTHSDDSELDLSLFTENVQQQHGYVIRVPTSGCRSKNYLVKDFDTLRDIHKYIAEVTK